MDKSKSTPLAACRLSLIATGAAFKLDVVEEALPGTIRELLSVPTLFPWGRAQATMLKL